MKLIQITRGTFGHRDGRQIIPKTKNDPPFEVDDATAERLIAKKVAAYVEPAPDAPPAEEPITYDKMAFHDLRSLAIERGIEVSGLNSKQKLLDALQVLDDEVEPLEDDGEAPPDISPAEPVE